jgi:hypothetical protein
MVEYRDPVHVVPHDFNNSTITYNGETKIEGVESFEADFDEEETTTQAVSDGMALFVDSPIRTGRITLQILEAHPSNEILWGAWESKEIFTLDHICSSIDKYKVSGKFKCNKRPVQSRTREATVVEWVFVSPYMESRGGSFKLQSV